MSPYNKKGIKFMTSEELIKYKRERREKYLAKNAPESAENTVDVSRDTTEHQQTIKSDSETNKSKYSDYQRKWRIDHAEELREKRRRYKATIRQAKIDAGIIKPRQRKEPDEPKPPQTKQKKEKLSAEERRERNRLANIAYRERKREERKAQDKGTGERIRRHSYEPVPDEQKLSVIVGENLRRGEDAARVVVSVFPLCQKYATSVLSPEGVLSVTFFETEEAAFQSVSRYHLHRFRDISQEALADYLKMKEVNDYDTSRKSRSDGPGTEKAGGGKQSCIEE